MKTAEKIALCRKRRGLSQEQLAAALSISRQAVSRWETGESLPDTERVVGLSRLLGVTTDYLLLDEVSDEAPPAAQQKAPPEMSDIYGDIGYGVRPSERRRGRAVQMLRHALSVCRQKGLKTVRLGCFKDNIGSSRTIERCGGVLAAENDNYQKGRMSRYYDIAL